MWVVFDDEQRSVGRPQSITVICNTRHRDRRKARGAHLGGQYRLRELCISHTNVRCGGSQISLGQIERERTAFVRRASQLNLASQQARQFPADRQSQARAAILSARAGIRLLKSLKYDSLFIKRNTNTSIGNFEGDYGRHAAQYRVILTPPARGYRHGQVDASLFGKLKRVRQ